jgi:hypothetical protein
MRHARTHEPGTRAAGIHYCAIERSIGCRHLLAGRRQAAAITLASVRDCNNGPGDGFQRRAAHVGSEQLCSLHGPGNSSSLTSVRTFGEPYGSQFSAARRDFVDANGDTTQDRGVRGLLVVTVSPLVVFGGGPAIILPVLLVFWLAGLAQAVGVPVSNHGVDAFNLMPPNVIGGVLIAIGLVVSLGAYWWLAGVLSRVFVKTR